MPYSDKLKLSVLDLTQAELATDADKECGLYDWARLFKAETWEEVHMIAEKNDVYKAVATQVRKLTEEERIRLQCQAREEYYKTQEYIQDLHRKEMEEVTAKLDEAEAANAEKDSVIAEKDSLIAEKDRIIAELKAQLAAQSSSDQ